MNLSAKLKRTLTLSCLTLAGFILCSCVTGVDQIRKEITRQSNRHTGSGVIVRQDDGDTWIHSYAEVALGRARVLQSSDLKTISERSGGAVAISFVTPKHRRGLPISLELNDEAAWVAFLDALRGSILVSRILQEEAVKATVLLAEPESDVAISASYSLDSEGIRFVVAIPVDSQTNSALPVFAEAASRMAHELFHIHHRLKRSPSNSVDEETAAYLSGYCAQSKFAQALGMGLEARLTFPSNRMRRAFPELESGRFSPQMADLRHLGPPSAIGRTLAVAALSQYGNYPATNLGDMGQTKRLQRACASFLEYIPSFTEGEL